MPASTREQRAQLKQDLVDAVAYLREGRGWTHERIALHLGRSWSWIWFVCLENGIDKPGARRRAHRMPASAVRPGVTVRSFTVDQDRELLALERELPNYAEIGRRIGRARQTVVARLATLARRDERAIGGGLGNG